MRRTGSTSGGGGQVAWQRGGSTSQRSVSSSGKRIGSRSSTPTQQTRKRGPPVAPSGKVGGTLTAVSVQKRPQRPTREASDSETGPTTKLDGHVKCMTSADTTIWCSEPDGSISIRERNGTTFGLIQREAGSPTITSLLFIPENGSRGPRVLLGQSDGTITNVDAVRGDRRSQDTQPHSGPITNLTLLSSGLVASGGADCIICLLEVQQNSVTVLFTTTLKSPIRTMSNRFDKLYVGTAHGHLSLYSTRHKDKIDQVTEAQLHFGITSIAISKDKFLWVSSDKGAIHIIDKESLRIKTSVGGRGEGAAYAMVSPSSGKIWIFRESGSVSVWDPNTLEVIRTLQSGVKGLPTCVLPVTAVVADVEIWSSSQQENNIHLWRDADYQIPIWCSSMIQQATDSVKERDQTIKGLLSAKEHLQQQLTFLKDESQQESLASTLSAETEMAKRIRIESEYSELKTILQQAYEVHCKMSVNSASTTEMPTFRKMVASLLAASKRLDELQDFVAEEGAQLAALQASKAELNARFLDLQKESQRERSNRNDNDHQLKIEALRSLRESFPKTDESDSIAALLSLMSSVIPIRPEERDREQEHNSPLREISALVERISSKHESINDILSVYEDLTKLLGSDVPIVQAVCDLIDNTRLGAGDTNTSSNNDTLGRISQLFAQFGYSSDVEMATRKLLEEASTNPLRKLYTELFGSEPGTDSAVDIASQIGTAVADIQQGCDAIIIYEALLEQPLPKNLSQGAILSAIMDTVAELKANHRHGGIIALHEKVFGRTIDENTSLDAMCCNLENAISDLKQGHQPTEIKNLYEDLFGLTIESQSMTGQEMSNRIIDMVTEFQQQQQPPQQVGVSADMKHLYEALFGATIESQSMSASAMSGRIIDMITELRQIQSPDALREIATLASPFLNIPATATDDEVTDAVKENLTLGSQTLTELADRLGIDENSRGSFEGLTDSVKKEVHRLKTTNFIEIDDLRKTVRSCKGGHDYSINSLEDLETFLENRHQQPTSNITNLESVFAERDELQNDVSVLAAELERVKETLVEEQARRDSRREELETVIASMQSQRTALEERSDADARKMCDLKELTQTQEDTISRLTLALAELKALREADHREISSKDDQLQELYTTLDSRPDEGDAAKVASKLGMAQERCRNLELQLESAKKTQLQEGSLLKEKIASLEKRLSSQDAELLNIRGSRESFSTEIVSLKNQHAGEIQTLEDCSSRQEASLVSKVASLENEKGRLTDMIEGLKSALKRVNGQLRATGSQLEEKKAYIAELVEQQQQQQRQHS
eukprot:TRINITY_DN22610_c0_g1_i1.p1 TRINITY_DN22610_c0_g1~~TRINITY_DN22610_c0_g1_i1.p1  ORF type:complete len:1297 (+),score=308.41 TRINITY_DN22610_c0_g1_i1:27-3917(+)